MRLPGLPEVFTLRSLVLILLALLFVLRFDFWWWQDARLLGGLPIGLSYHLGYCLAVSVVMALVVRFAWPRGVAKTSVSEDPPKGESSGPLAGESR